MTSHQRVKHIKPGAEGSSPIDLLDKTVVGEVEADASMGRTRSVSTRDRLWKSCLNGPVMISRLNDRRSMVPRGELDGRECEIA